MMIRLLTLQVVIASLSVPVLPAGQNGAGTAQTPVDIPPSAMALQDYEREVLYPWLWARGYSRPELGWTVDSQVRDTGPFIAGSY